jgi:hypothetical protein
VPPAPTAHTGAFRTGRVPGDGIQARPRHSAPARSQIPAGDPAAGPRTATPRGLGRFRRKGNPTPSTGTRV